MLVRRGITRTVWLTRHHAIKVPSLRRYGRGRGGVLWSICNGILANQSEHRWWINSHDPALCPCLHSWFGGIVNVYPRCDPIGDDYAGPWPEPQWPGPMPGDHKPDNYGRLGGRLVRIDYDMSRTDHGHGFDQPCDCGSQPR